MKRHLVLAFSLAAVVSMAMLTGCKGKKEEQTAPKEDLIKVALVTPSLLGDKSFVDQAARGAEKANQELPVKVDIIECQGVSEHESAMRGAINNGYDLILGLGLDAEMMVNLANEYPDQMFGSPSELYADNLPDNLASLMVNVHESSFLAGVVAGMLTKTNKIGAVCGGDAPGLNQFFYGYKQGALEVNPDCEVFVNYLGFNFDNPTLGKESAISLYDEGCDIVYQVAGLSGEGVLSAAAEKGLYAIGVDSVQDDQYPGNIITSVIKRVDSTTFELIKEYVDGTFKGGFRSLDLKDDASDLSWSVGNTTFKDNAPADMVAKIPEVEKAVEDYKAKIIAGDFEVYNALTDDLWDSLK